MSNKNKKASKAQSAPGGTKKTNHEEQRSIDNKEKVEQLEDQLKRAVADFQNLEKRHTEDKRQFVKYANFELLTRLLPAFDSLFLADKYIEDEGLKYTVKSVNDAFEQVGVRRIETDGKDYDPQTMECTETVQGEEGKIVEEVRPGFLLHDKVLRPAHVKVGKEERN